MVNLLPTLSLKVHSYPECIWEVSTRYKRTAAESRMRSRQWELHHCSIVYTVVIWNSAFLSADVRYQLFCFDFSVDYYSILLYFFL